MAANSLMQQTMQGVRIISPAAASALVGWFGEASCYYARQLDVLRLCRDPDDIDLLSPVAPSSRGVRAVLKDLGEGLKFIFTHPTYSFVILSMTVGMFAMAAFGALVSVFVRKGMFYTEAPIYTEPFNR